MDHTKGVLRAGIELAIHCAAAGCQAIAPTDGSVKISDQMVGYDLNEWINFHIRSDCRLGSNS